MTTRYQLVQRLVASEFARRGWTYDLAECRALAESLAEDTAPDPRHLAGKLNRYALAQQVPPRSDVEDAIEAIKEQIEKQLAGTEPASPTSMRLLFVAAGPADEQRLRLAAEHRDIRDAVRSSTHRDQVALDETLAARPGDLIGELNRFRPTILHLAGHGGPSGIALEDARGRAADVSTTRLTELVSLADPALQLVVLNSCDSANQAQPIAAVVGAAIGMARSIGDEAARIFAVQIYSSLCEGVPLQRAFDQARLQIGLQGLNEDKTPQLYLRPGVDATQIRFA